MGFNYLFIFPPCYVALCASKARHRLGSESVSWCLETSHFLRLPSWDRAPSLPLLSLFLSSIFFPTSFRRQWTAFLGAWCPLLTFRSCFVEFTQHVHVLLMNLWGRKWSPHPIPLPSYDHPPCINFLQPASRDCRTNSVFLWFCKATTSRKKNVTCLSAYVCDIKTAVQVRFSSAYIFPHPSLAQKEPTNGFRHWGLFSSNLNLATGKTSSLLLPETIITVKKITRKLFPIEEAFQCKKARDLDWLVLISYSYEEFFLRELLFKIILQKTRLMDKVLKFKWRKVEIF